ncbi:MAG: hypothetical protein SPG69_09930, partial [Bacteroides pyogenes]|uniref:hypothetical protein n=1 Tax=Bacteroides pyogenes TaxID=310300 RepID=UPI002A91B07D
NPDKEKAGKGPILCRTDGKDKHFIPITPNFNGEFFKWGKQNIKPKPDFCNMSTLESPPTPGKRVQK